MDHLARTRHEGASLQVALAWASRLEDQLRHLIIEVAIDEALFIDTEDATESAVAQLAIARLVTLDRDPSDPSSCSGDAPDPIALRGAAQAGVKQTRLRERAHGTPNDDGETPLRVHEETLVRGFGVGRDRVRAALLAYNGLPATDRHAFFELSVKRTDYSSLTGSANPDSRWPSPEAFRNSIQRSLAALYAREDERPRPAHDTIHPDLLAFIHEAADERASRVLISLATSGRKEGASNVPAVGKTSIEKLEAKLLATFHEELADLYWHVGERIIHTDPATAQFLSAAQRARRESDLSAEEPWRARVADMRIAGRAFGAEPAEHLVRLGRLAAGAAVSLIDIARAGYALVPLAGYRIHEAWALEAQGALDAAKLVLRGNLERPLGGDDQGRALNNLGHIASIEQDIGAQLAYYEQAARLLPLAAPTVCFWARLTLLHGTLAQQALAMLQVEAVSESAPLPFEECLAAHRVEALSNSPLVPSVPQATWRQASPNATRLLELLSQD